MTGRHGVHACNFGTWETEEELEIDTSYGCKARPCHSKQTTAKTDKNIRSLLKFEFGVNNEYLFR